MIFKRDNGAFGIAGDGKYYSVNVPLKDGADDQTYDSFFKMIMTSVMNRYQPEAIVYQSGKGLESFQA